MLYKITLLASALLSSTVFASPAPIIVSTINADSGDKSPKIGFTLSTAKRPFVGIDDQNTILPYFSYRNKDFYIESLDLGYNLVRKDGVSLDVIATPRFYERREGFADNDELDGTNRTRETYFAGLSSQIHLNDYGALTLQVLYDVIESNGIESVAQLSKTFAVSETFKFIPSIGINHQNSVLVDYFYGVNSDEVLPNRTAYNGASSINYNVTLNASWEIAKNIELLAQFKYEIIGEGITESSIVDEDELYFFTTGLVFRY